MIVVRVELHSAITGIVTNLGQLVIANDGTGSRTRSNYTVTQHDKSKPVIFNLDKPQYAKDNFRSFRKTISVKNHARLAESGWKLVAKALKELGH